MTEMEELLEQRRRERLEIATAAMQGFIVRFADGTWKELAVEAFEVADAMLAEAESTSP